MLNNLLNEKNDRKLLSVFALLSVIIALAYRCLFGFFNVDSYSTTSYAFSYLKYGLSSRMLLGTVYDLFCKVFPFMYSWQGLFAFMLLLALGFAFTLYKFADYVLCKFNDSGIRRNILCISALAFMWLIPSYIAGQNFGKTDTFIFIINIIQAYLLIENKHEWFVPLLSLLGVLTHEGYLCMTAPVIIAIQVYKAVKAPKDRKLYYWLLFALNLILICAPAVYFVFFKAQGNEQMWIDAYNVSAYLNSEGGVHNGYISQRLNYAPGFTKGTSKDALLKANEIKETPIFLILFSPVIYRFIKAIKEYFRIEKKGLTIVLLLIGPVLIGVEFYIFCDFGRYVTWLIFYYFILYLFVVSKKCFELKTVYNYNINKLCLLLTHALVLTPFHSSCYTALSLIIKGVLNLWKLPY